MQDRILLDCAQSVSSFRGMGFYSFALIEVLCPDAEVVCVVKKSHAKLDHLKKKYPNLSVVKINLPHTIIEQIIIPLIIMFWGIKKYISAGDSVSILGVRLCKTYILLHDIYFTRKVRISSLKRLLGKLYRKFTIKHGVHSAFKIVTVSNFTKHEICKHYEIIADTVEVLGNPLRYKVELNCCKDNILLMVTGSDPQKNVRWAIQSLVSNSILQNFDALLIAGINDESEINVVSHPKITFLGYVESEALESYYQRAKICILPSLHESFGVPIIEALSKGCIVCASDRGAFPEVGDKFCFYFDPTSEKSFFSAMEKSNLTSAPETGLSDYLEKFKKQNFYATAKEIFL